MKHIKKIYFLYVSVIAGIILIALLISHITGIDMSYTGLGLVDSLLIYMPYDQSETYPPCLLSEHTDSLIVYSSDEQDDIFCECISNTGDLLESSRHFRIIQPIGLPSRYLRYEILNQDGDIVGCFITSATTWIEYVNKNVLEIGWSAGTGVRVVRFYSIKDDMLSEFFETPFLLNYDTLAYIARLDEGCLVLIVQNIFNPEIFHREFFFEEFSPLAHPSSCTYVEYLGENQIKVAPLFDADFNEKHVILDLR